MNMMIRIMFFILIYICWYTIRTMEQTDGNGRRWSSMERREVRWREKTGVEIKVLTCFAARAYYKFVRLHSIQISKFIIFLENNLHIIRGLLSKLFTTKYMIFIK